MMTYTSILLTILAAATATACSTGSDTGTTSDKSGTSPSGSSGGGAKESSGSAPVASCQSGQTNVATEWYAVSECKTYFDTVQRCTCASQTDKASCQKQFSSSLAASLCYPASLTFSAASAKTACEQALSSYKQAAPTCS